MSCRDWRHYLAAGGLALALWVGAASAQQVQKSPEASKAPAAPQASGGPQLEPPSVQPAPEPPAPKDAAKAPEKKSPVAKLAGIELGSWPDYAIVAFTAFLAWLSWRQHLLEKRLADDTADSIEIAKQAAEAATDSAEASQRMAGAAREANEIAANNARDQLRAYVHVEKVQALWRDQGVELGIWVVNTGQTPATFFALACTSEIVEPGGYEKVFPTGLRYKRWPALGAGRDLSAKIRPAGAVGLKVTQIRADQTNMLRVAGSVIYGDIFGALYESEFAFLLRDRTQAAMSRSTEVGRVYAPFEGEIDYRLNAEDTHTDENA